MARCRRAHLPAGLNRRHGNSHRVRFTSWPAWRALGRARGPTPVPAPNRFNGPWRPLNGEPCQCYVLVPDRALNPAALARCWRWSLPWHTRHCGGGASCVTLTIQSSSVHSRAGAARIRSSWHTRLAAVKRAVSPSPASPAASVLVLAPPFYLQSRPGAIASPWSCAMSRRRVFKNNRFLTPTAHRAGSASGHHDQTTESAGDRHHFGQLHRQGQRLTPWGASLPACCWLPHIILLGGALVHPGSWQWH